MTVPNVLPKLTDREVVLLYREWSEGVFAAGFMSLPRDGRLPPWFLVWLRKELGRNREGYEDDLVRRWRKEELANA